MGDEIRATGELLTVFLEFLQTGNGTTLILMLLVPLLTVGAAFMRRHDLALLNSQINACQAQHQHCETKNKKLTEAIWLFMSGNTDAAMLVIQEQMQE